MAEFLKAYNLTAGHEGGYANVEGDKGGETYCGISRKFWPNFKGWGIIDSIKREREIKHNEIIKNDLLDMMVKDFYKLEFWDYNRLDEIYNQKITNEVYDTGVNMGRKHAAKLLQQALNFLNKDEQDYRDIPEDGIIGYETITMVNNHPNQNAIVKTINGLQFMRYIEICRKDKLQEKFFYGWLKRT